MSLELQDSIILITSSSPDNTRFGTGFVIHQDERATYLLTCAHVVRDVGGSEKVNAGGITATLIASGEEDGLDLAVLQVERLLNRPSLRLRASGEKGSAFITAGFQSFNKDFLIRPLRGSLGEQIGLEPKGRTNRIDAWDLRIVDDYYLQPGYSGSPVVDAASGYVLGIVSHRQGEGEKGLAISIKALARIWREMPFDLDDAPKQGLAGDTQTRDNTQEPPETRIERQRRFEAAMPQTSRVGRQTEIKLMLALQDSPGLRAHLPSWTEAGDVITKKDVLRNDVPIEFPVDPVTHQLLPSYVFLAVTAPSFEIEQAVKRFYIPPKLDSGVVTFFLTPCVRQEFGRVVVEIFKDEQQTILLGSLTLTTNIRSRQDDLVEVVWQLVALPFSAKVRKPDREKEKKLQRYEQVLAEATRYEYPLSADTRYELQRLQQVLRLTDEDIVSIKARTADLLPTPLPPAACAARDACASPRPYRYRFPWISWSLGQITLITVLLLFFYPSFGLVWSVIFSLVFTITWSCMVRLTRWLFRRLLS